MIAHILHNCNSRHVKNSSVKEREREHMTSHSMMLTCMLEWLAPNALSWAMPLNAGLAKQLRTHTHTHTHTRTQTTFFTIEGIGHQCS